MKSVEQRKVTIRPGFSGTVPIFTAASRNKSQFFLTGRPFVPFLANVLRYVRYMLSAVRLSVVCDVGAPYSGG